MATSSQESLSEPWPDAILVPVSAGELLDKLTILEIKRERIQDSQKLTNVLFEYDVLRKVREQKVPLSGEVIPLVQELKKINEALWQIEDELREHERKGDFAASFVELARFVYRWNDRRAEVKRRINELLGSKIVEEKCYNGS